MPGEAGCDSMGAAKEFASPIESGQNATFLTADNSSQCSAQGSSCRKRVTVGAARANYRRWHSLKHLPAASPAVHSHDFQLFAIHRPEQRARHATDAFGAIAPTSTRYTFDGAIP